MPTRNSYVRSLLNAELFSDDGVIVEHAPVTDSVCIFLDTECVERLSKNDHLHAARLNYVSVEAARARATNLADYVQNHGYVGIHYARRDCVVFVFKTDDAYE